jgi:hypothetical protein
MTRRTRLSAGSPPGCGIIAFPVVVFLVLVEALITFIAGRALRDFFTGGDFGLGMARAGAFRFRSGRPVGTCPRASSPRWPKPSWTSPA